MFYYTKGKTLFCCTSAEVSINKKKKGLTNKKKCCTLKIITDQDPCKSDVEFFFKVLMQIILISMRIEEYQKYLPILTFEEKKDELSFQ